MYFQSTNYFIIDVMKSVSNSMNAKDFIMTILVYEILEMKNDFWKVKRNNTIRLKENEITKNLCEVMFVDLVLT